MPREMTFEEVKGIRPEPRPLTDSKKYRDFIHERNKALEFLLFYYQGKIDEIVDRLHEAVELVAVHMHAVGQNRRVDWDQALVNIFGNAARECIQLVRRMRKTLYVLSAVGEAEGIGRAIGKATINLRNTFLNEKIASASMHGATMPDKIMLGFRRLQRDVVDAIETTLVMQGDVSFLREEIDLAFPRVRKVKPLSKKRVFSHKRLKEANKPTDNFDGLITGFIDDETWQDLVDDYLDANIPTRGPEDKVTIVSPGKEPEERYTWEVEQEINQDFLNQVRAGQIDAAKQNGIEEFMWIAIIDKATDECCTWRHGLTSSEIEKELDGDHRGDECEAVVPPAHFNCRCNLAPVTKEVLDEEPLELGDFDTWLK